ncbi:hypothetical protein [Aquimarina mytili]|uniref:Uncharacterized protein n=1 Tax=Aquimarina mytili TaxID=874423 RepID=A0A937D801_9FLAO|nr:hypothetical protein [Aquimarina mytili]MBL0686094.1 hypothetical protein [Aquimarina mytili]
MRKLTLLILPILFCYCSGSKPKFSIDATKACAGDEIEFTWRESKPTFRFTVVPPDDNVEIAALNERINSENKGSAKIEVRRDTKMALIDGDKVIWENNIAVVPPESSYPLVFQFLCKSERYSSNSLTNEWTDSAIIQTVENQSSVTVFLEIIGHPYTIFPGETINISKAEELVASNYVVTNRLKPDERCPFDDSGTVEGEEDRPVKIPPPIRLVFTYKCPGS